ncbi:MAG: N-formylglutamate amidohydrolase [Caulobacteraceae bacterium]
MDSGEAAAPIPFDILAAEGELRPAVFASPHSGSHYPADMAPARSLGVGALRLSEDLLVDQLIAPAARAGFPVILARYGRAYVDLNRAPDEIDAEMLAPGATLACRPTPKVAAGLGVIPRLGADSRRLYDRRLSEAEAVRRLSLVHEPYHRAVADLLERARARHGASLLIDWHSMPSAALADPRGVDMVLGDRHGDSCSPEVTAWLESLLRQAGFRVARNTPYAGGYGVERHGTPADGRHAIQVEINRSIYADERARAPGRNYAAFTATLDQIFREMARADWPAMLRRVKKTAPEGAA